METSFSKTGYYLACDDGSYLYLCSLDQVPNIVRVSTKEEALRDEALLKWLKLPWWKKVFIPIPEEGVTR